MRDITPSREARLNRPVRLEPFKEGPRLFAWVLQNGRLTPQIWFTDPRAGSLDMTAVASWHLHPSEFELSLDQLAAKFKAPEVAL